MQPSTHSSSTGEAAAIARCRELLGDEAAGLSDQDVEALQRHADAMARVIVEMFLQKAA